MISDDRIMYMYAVATIYIQSTIYYLIINLFPCHRGTLVRLWAAYCCVNFYCNELFKVVKVIIVVMGNRR